MPFDSIAANAPSIFVSTTAELQAAYADLSNGKGGTIYLTSDFSSRGIIDLDKGGNEPVHITSANPSNPVQVAQIDLDEVQNVKFSNIEVDSSKIAKSDFAGDLNVIDCQDIVFDEMTLTSDGSLVYGTDGYVNGGRGVMIRGSEDVTLSNSTLTGYYKGVTLLQSDDLTLEGNEFTAIQGDGIVISEVRGALIKDNYLHDFAFTPNNVNHCDFIQMHAGPTATIGTQDVTITGNVMDTGNDSSVQGIWMTSRKYDASGKDSDLFKNITITDNLIYTASANGIGLNTVDGGLIANNTLLYNPEAYTQHSYGQTSYEPRIWVGDDAKNVQVIDNITPAIVPTKGDMTEKGNVIIEYDSTNDPYYVGKHFVDVANGGELDPTDWQLKSGSPLVGKGAAVTQPGGDGTPYTGDASDFAQAPVVAAPVENFSDDAEIVLDAVPEPAPKPKPAPYIPPEPQIVIDSDTLLALDFSGAIVADTSEYDSTIQSAAARNLIDDGGNAAYQIGGKKMVRFDVDNAQLHNLESFGFEMDMRVLSMTDYGRFLHFPRAFEAQIEKDGTVTFSLTTDAGTFEVNSGEPVFDDKETHNFAVGFDDTTGQLSMVIDGVVVDTTEASGSTAEGLYHGLTVGTLWGNSVNAVVDNIYLGKDPMDAGVDLSLEVGEVYDPSTNAGGSGGFGTSGQGGIPDPDVPIDPSDALFAMDFEADTLQDLSSYGSDLKVANDSGLVSSEAGQGFLISKGSKITLDKGNAQLHELDSFGIRLDIQLLDNAETGRFLHFPRAFEASVEEDRSISFKLTTDKGTFTVNSGETTLDDLDTHSFAVGYDEDNGRLTMEIDGQAVDSVAASGATSPEVHHGLTIGSVWGDSVTAVVDNVWFGDDPAAVGVDTTAGVIFALQSTAVDPSDLAATEADEELGDLEDDLLIA